MTKQNQKDQTTNSTQPATGEPKASPQQTSGKPIAGYAISFFLGLCVMAGINFLLTYTSVPAQTETVPDVSGLVTVASSTATDAAAVSTGTAVATSSAKTESTASAAPEFTCQLMTSDLLQEYFGQNNPAAFKKPASHKADGPYIKCRKGARKENDDGTFDVSACKICFPAVE